MTLKEFLANSPDASELTVTSGTESDWLFLGDYKIYGNFLQLIEKRFLGDLRTGVIVEVSPGMHVIEARVMSFNEGRHISRIRIRPQNLECSPAHKIDEIHSGDGGLAVSDVDALSRALDADRRGFHAWHKDLLSEAFEEAGVAYWTARQHGVSLLRRRFWGRLLSRLCPDARREDRRGGNRIHPSRYPLPGSVEMVTETHPCKRQPEPVVFFR